MLLIEDKSWFRSYVVPSLNDNGFEVVAEAPSGETAEEYIASLAYDLALVDIELDDMDTTGLSLIPLIRHANPRLGSRCSPATWTRRVT